jgi:hypothetical protein
VSNKNKPPWRGPQFPSIPSWLRETAQRLNEAISPEDREGIRRLVEQAQQALKAPAAQAQQDKSKLSSSKRRQGALRIEFPHLNKALNALEKKWPDPRARVTEKQIKFVSKFLRDHGDEVEETQRQTIRRRIKERRKAQIEGKQRKS